MKHDVKYIIKRILIGVGIILVMGFLKSCNVMAYSDNAYWYYDVNLPERTFFTDCTSSNTCNTSLGSTITSYSFPYSVDYITKSIATVTSNDGYVSIGTAGIVILNQDSKINLKSGYLYTINYFVCSNANLGSGIQWNIYSAVQSNQATIYSQIINESTIGLNNSSLTDIQATNYCRLFSSLIVPNSDSVNTAIHFRKPSGTASTTRINLIGVEVIENGIYSSTVASAIQSVINSSGLATASNINEVKSAVNGVSQQVTALNDSIEDQTEQQQENHEELMNTLNDDSVNGANSEVDSLIQNSTFQDTSGLNAIISLPLNFIQNLSNQCTPFTLTIPFIDKPVNFPCIRALLQSKVPTLYNVLTIAINGFIIYRILLEIFAIVKRAKDPEDDRIEVLDL